MMINNIIDLCHEFGLTPCSGYPMHEPWTDDFGRRFELKNCVNYGHEIWNLGGSLRGGCLERDVIFCRFGLKTENGNLKYGSVLFQFPIEKSEIIKCVKSFKEECEKMISLFPLSELRKMEIDMDEKIRKEFIDLL